MNRQTHSILYSAIGAALIAALSQISLPIGPVPFTLQTLAIGLIACLYPLREALASVLLYLTMGAMGLPVFAQFAGGIDKLFSPTAGFLWGFVLFAGVTAYLTPPSSSPIRVFLATTLGTALCFALGLVVFQSITQASWKDSLSWTVLPFLLPDLAKISLVTFSYRLLQQPLQKNSLLF